MAKLHTLTASLTVPVCPTNKMPPKTVERSVIQLLVLSHFNENTKNHKVLKH
jgi:hypothetical protein